MDTPALVISRGWGQEVVLFFSYLFVLCLNYGSRAWWLLSSEKPWWWMCPSKRRKKSSPWVKKKYGEKESKLKNKIPIIIANSCRRHSIFQNIFILMISFDCYSNPGDVYLNYSHWADVETETVIMVGCFAWPAALLVMRRLKFKSSGCKSHIPPIS